MIYPRAARNGASHSHFQFGLDSNRQDTMNGHLSARLSWASLVEMYNAAKAQSRRRTCHECDWCWYKPIPRHFVGPLKHFAHNLLRLLNEFRATDNSTPEGLQRYDPKVWGECGLRSDFMPSHHPRLGYFESLLWGYMTLNLLIADPERTPSLMIPNEYAPIAIRCMLGYDYEKHPSHRSDHLRQAFSGKRLKPPTPEVLKILHDHAAVMFRCMYSLTGENKLLDETRLTELVFEFFDWHPPVQNKTQEDQQN